MKLLVSLMKTSWLGTAQAAALDTAHPRVPCTTLHMEAYRINTTRHRDMHMANKLH